MTTSAEHEAIERVSQEVRNERHHQIEDHGRDAAHDDRHDLAAWGWHLLRRVTEVVAPPTVIPLSRLEARRLLIEVAAIAQAAVESLDRAADASTDPNL